MEGEEIRVKENDERKAGKTIVLGIRTDSKSRELLTWTLVNLAISGDRVIAIHVRRLSYPSVRADQYFDQLEPMRKAYEGFCRLKQIDLVIKFCRGFSVRRTLVHQAKSCSASYLILGESKSSNAIRFSLTSIPKYCAQRLAPGCSVVAVNSGKIVFGSGAVETRRLAGQDGKASKFLLLHMKKGEPLEYLLEMKSREGYLLEEKCSVCGTVSGTQYSNVDGGLLESKSDAPMNSNFSITFGTQGLTDEVGSSWSISRKTTLTHRRTLSMEGSRTPLFQLSKWISGRSSTYSPNHSVGKHRRSDTFTAGSLYKEDSLSPFHLEESNGRINMEYLQEKCSLWCKLFSYTELMQATCNFSVDRLIGKGGSSLVYKGILPNGKELAIKVLKPSKDSLQQFISEIDVITTLNHNNIIFLLGFCLWDNKLVLIYNFMSRGSLEEALHGSKERNCALHWGDRYKISIAVAKALDYLHGRGGAESVIHMDVKSSNILLSEDFVPMLSDFGLARRPTGSVSHISCSYLAGTFGYLAPEYFMFGQISTKTDVYAFGVVLLELISGRKPICSDGLKGDQSLVMWAMPILRSGNFQGLVDPRLEGKYNIEQMEWMVLAAYLCLNRDSQSRPTVPCVLKLLHGDKALVQAKSQFDSSENSYNLQDDDPCLIPDIKSHESVLMLNSEVDSPSASSNELLPAFTTDGTSVEDYLLGR